MSDYKSNYDFPVEHFIDKAACDQDKFVEKYPEYDGRGTLIAIIDYGVDPDLPSMKVTTTGERKLVDLIDCSGENDVDTTVIRRATDGILEGLTGRKLNIPEDWVNPTGDYHIGVKEIFELFNKEVVKRVKEARGKAYKNSHALSVYEASVVLEEDVSSRGKNSTELSHKFERNDLLEKMEYLKKAKDLADDGPMADVVAWNDGQNWKACIDTSYCGNLLECTPMASFRINGEYSKLSYEDQLTYTFRIASDGNWVQIVVPRDSHGTHVADIAAGYYPNEPKRNGLAPGARIISIGVPRCQRSTDYGNYIEALNICKKLRVDVINFSLKLSFHIENYGNFLTELSNVTYKHNIIVVKSAGNSGPGISTVDAVTALDSTIAVASFMTNNLKETVYSSFSSNDGYICDYSARGPSRSGSLGVSVCAPGAALAATSRDTLASCAAFTGTSMSSPYVAGVVACLLSGLRMQNKEWNHYQIKLALENTAKSYSEKLCKLSYGHGLVQICEAFEYLSSINSNEFLSKVVRIGPIVDKEPIPHKGIYIRTKNEQKIAKHNINVMARFNEIEQGNLSQSFFERKFRLVTDRPWINIPDNFFLAGQKHSFEAKIDYSAVPEGDVVYAEIEGIDAENPVLGPLFRVPITVINPVEVTEKTHFKDVFTASVGAVVPFRRFIEVPSHANIMVFNVSTVTLPAGDELVVHTVLLKDNKLADISKKSLTFADNKFESWEKMVTPGETVEVCLTRSVNGDEAPIQILVELLFKGVQAGPIVTQHSSQITKVILETKAYTSLKFKPEIVLEKVVIPLIVIDSKIEPTETVYGSTSYRLLLVYKLEVKERCEIVFKIEESIACQMLDVGFMVFDSNNFYLPTNSHYRDKGKYTIRAQIMHEDQEVLKKLSNITVNALLTLGATTEVKMRATTLPAIEFKEELDEYRNWEYKTSIGPATQKILYFRLGIQRLSMYSPVVLPAGSYLLGSIQLDSSTGNPVYEGSKVDVIYYLDDCSSPLDDKKELIFNVAETKKSATEAYEELVRDSAIDCFSKCKIPEKQDELYIELRTKYPTHLPLHVERLDQLSQKELTPEIRTARVEVIQTILDLCNPEKVLSFFGGNNTYVEKEVKDEMEMNKMQIIATLQKKFTFMADEFLLVKEDVIEYFKPVVKKIDKSAGNQRGTTELAAPNGLPSTPDSGVSTRAATPIITAKNEEVTHVMNITEVNDSYMELLRWIKEDNGKMLLLSAKHAICNDHYGRALFYLSKHCKRIKEFGFSTKKEGLAMAKICEKLNWTHIANRITSNILVKNPASFRAFKGNHCKFD